MGAGRARAGTQPRALRRLAVRLVAEDRAFDALAVVGLVAITAATRAARLAPPSLWSDDAWRAMVERVDSVGELDAMAFTTPGFLIGLKGWFAVVGFSEVRAQALPFLAGVVAPALVYWLFRRRIGRGPALAAGAVLVASPQLAIQSTHVKHYTTEVVLGTLLLALALRVADRPSSRRRWAALAAAGLLAIVVSATLALVVASAVAAGLLAARREGVATLRAAWPPVAALGAAGLLWYAAFLRPRANDALTSLWSRYTVAVDDGPLDAVGQAADLLRRLAGGFSWLPPLLVLTALVAAGVVVARRRPVLAVATLLPLLLALAAATLGPLPLGAGRTDIWLYPSSALLLGGALGLAVGDGPRARLAVLGGAVLLVALAPPAPPYPDTPVSPFVADVDRRAAADEVVLVHPTSRWAYALYTSAGVDIEADPRAPAGFDVVIHDRRVVVLPRLRRRSDATQRVVCRAAGRTDRIWYVGAGAGPGRRERVEEMLAHAGLDEVGAEEAGNSWLSEWTPADGGGTGGCGPAAGQDAA